MKRLRVMLALAAALVMAAETIAFLTWHEEVTNIDFALEVLLPLFMVGVAVAAFVAVGHRPREVVRNRAFGSAIMALAVELGSFLMATRAFSVAGRLEALHSPTGHLYAEGAWMVAAGVLQLAAVLLAAMVAWILRNAGRPQPASLTEN